MNPLHVLSIFILLGCAGAQESNTSVVAQSPSASTTLPIQTILPIPSYWNLPITVCVHDFPPFVFCSQIDKPSNYTGFDVEYLRHFFSDVKYNLTEGVDYNFVCTDWKTINTAMLPESSATVDCDIMAGGWTISKGRLAKGVRFSYPYNKADLTIVVQSSVSSTNGWAWVKPFTWELWVATLLTMAIFPLVLFFIEFMSLKRRVYRSDVGPGYEEALVRSFWTITGGETLEVSSLAARVSVLCFGFLSMIISATYTANLAAVLVQSVSYGDIKNVYDLRGKAVGTIPTYSATLRSQFGLVTSELNMDTTFDVENVLQDLQDGLLAGVIYDTPAIVYSLNQREGCKVVALPDKVLPFDMGFPLGVNISEPFRAQLQNAIISDQEAGILGTLAKTFLNAEEDKCEDSKSPAVTFQSVYGLWVILLAGIVIAALLVLYQRYKLREAGDWDFLEEDDDDDESDDGNADDNNRRTLKAQSYNGRGNGKQHQGYGIDEAVAQPGPYLSGNAPTFVRTISRRKPHLRAAASQTDLNGIGGEDGLQRKDSNKSTNKSNKSNKSHKARQVRTSALQEKGTLMGTERNWAAHDDSTV